MTTTPRTAAEINKRREAIGAELAKGRFTPVPNARALEREDEQLTREYVVALQRESEDARDAAEIAKRVGAARTTKAAQERETRIAAAVADAAR